MLTIVTFIACPLNGQKLDVDWLLEGPYQDYEGTYRIKTAIHFGQSSNWPAAQADLDALGQDVLDMLNQGYNQHGIYFTRKVVAVW